MMSPAIKHFSSYSPAELYGLFKDVYSSSGEMSETLEEKYPDLASFENDLAVLQSIPGAIALVAEIAHKPVAYVTIRPRRQSRLRHTADLNMGVAHIARGQGTGEFVLRAGLEQAFSSSELEIVYLMVRSDNAPAIRLYKKAGFETMTVLHRDTKIADSYFDGILMRKFVDT
jgi:ribosomal protein S18 acetylase RimI-like enzyme